EQRDVPDLQPFEEFDATLIEPGKEVPQVPGRNPIALFRRERDVNDPLAWHVCRRDTAVGQRDRVELVDRGGAPPVEELPAAIPRLLQLVALRNQPLQVQEV